MKRLTLILLLITGPAFAQGVVTTFYDNQPLTAEQLNAAFAQALAVSNSGVVGVPSKLNIGTDFNAGFGSIQAAAQVANTVTASNEYAAITQGFASASMVSGEYDTGSSFQSGVFSLFSTAVTNVHGDVENLYLFTRKEIPTGGIPGGHTIDGVWGLWNQIWDVTNLDSATGGGMLNEFDLQSNNSDNSGTRIGLNINGYHQIATTSGGYPEEWSVFLDLYTDSVTKQFVRTNGSYSVSDVELRDSTPLASTVLTTLGSPSAILHVSNVLLFTTGDGFSYPPVSATNTRSVLIGSNTTPYLVKAWAWDAQSGGTQPSSGTITLTTAVSTTDGTSGNAVVPITHTIWMPDNSSIAFDYAGKVYISSNGSDLTLNNTGTSGNIYLDTSTVYLNGILQASSAVYGGIASSNYLEMVGAGTGGAPTIRTGGSDTNVNLAIQTQGTGEIYTEAPVQPQLYTVATLPSCGAGTAGLTAMVSDATTPSYNGTLTGGGATYTPVVCNVGAWRSH